MQENAELTEKHNTGIEGILYEKGEPEIKASVFTGAFFEIYRC